MVALVGAQALVFSVHEPAKVPAAVEQEVVAPPPGLSLAPPPGLDLGADVVSTQTFQEAARQLGLENDLLKNQRLRQENEKLRAMLLTSCTHYGPCSQAPPQTAQREWTGGDFIPASEAGFGGAWPTKARRRRGCRGGARSRGDKRTLRDVSSEVSTEDGQPSEQSTVDSLRDSDSDVELIEIEDESGDAVDSTTA